ncbi:hypothetical protein L209DRAFT_385781 [Thermothelomyces heterothallicus CBS 203.75]
MFCPGLGLSALPSLDGGGSGTGSSRGRGVVTSVQCIITFRLATFSVPSPIFLVLADDRRRLVYHTLLCDPDVVHISSPVRSRLEQQNSARTYYLSRHLTTPHQRLFLAIEPSKPWAKT